MTKVNKLILFDWGNIVESHTEGYTNLNAWDEIFELCGFKGTHEELYSIIVRFRLSAITDEDKMEEIYETLKNELNLSASYDDFVSTYYKVTDKIDYFKDVADYEHSLKDKCYIGILSNLLIYDKKRLDKQVGLSNYDYVFLSFEVGSRKPDINIYEYVMEHVPFNKEDILFIDDREDNIETAKRMGWNTLHTTGLNLDLIKKTCEEFING